MTPRLSADAKRAVEATLDLQRAERRRDLDEVARCVAWRALALDCLVEDEAHDYASALSWAFEREQEALNTDV